MLITGFALAFCEPALTELIALPPPGSSTEQLAGKLSSFSASFPLLRPLPSPRRRTHLAGRRLCRGPPALSPIGFELWQLKAGRKSVKKNNSKKIRPEEEAFGLRSRCFSRLAVLSGAFIFWVKHPCPHTDVFLNSLVPLHFDVRIFLCLSARF